MQQLLLQQQHAAVYISIIILQQQCSIAAASDDLCTIPLGHAMSVTGNMTCCSSGNLKSQPASHGCACSNSKAHSKSNSSAGYTALNLTICSHLLS